MSYLHPLSNPATTSDMELFKVPMSNTAVEDSYSVEYRPNATIDDARSFEFNIPASDDFTDLNATFLQLTLKVTNAEGEDLVAANKLVPAQGFGNAIFEQLDLILSGTNVSAANNLYSYRSFIDNFFFKHENPAISSELWCTEAERKQAIATSASVNLFFRLHGDMFEQNNLLLNGVPIVLRLMRSKDSFSIYREAGDTVSTAKIKISNISLFIRRVKPFPEAQQGIAIALQKAPARYFLNRVDIKSCTIPKDISSYSFDNVYSGQIPKRIIVGMVNNTAFGGNLSSDPFKFQPFSVNYVALHCNGKQIPSVAYTPNLTNGDYARPFFDMFLLTNQDSTHSMLKTTYAEYKTHATFFVFSLASDPGVGTEVGLLDLVKRGSIRLDMKFQTALPSPVHLIVYAQFDSLLQIDQDRNILMDY